MTWVDPSNLVLSVALMLPAALVVAGEIEMAGVVVPVATLIGAVPVTEVTVPLPVPAPMVVLTAAASASCRMSKAKSVITLTVRFPALLLREMSWQELRDRLALPLNLHCLPLLC